MKKLYIGLMSGTSIDGIDAAVMRIDDGIEILAGMTAPYPAGLAQRLQEAVQKPASLTVDAIGQLDVAVGRAFAAAARALMDHESLSATDITAIGSHGQTIRHQPDIDPPFTLQIGDPNSIAALTGITTVADFRRRDMALGGQAAPLVPRFHAAVLAKPGEDRVVINIGGIANLSLLSADGHVAGFDSGPGNTLMDAWCQQHRGQPYDDDGEWAASGRIHDELLRDLLRDEYFLRPAPKSTGREYFDLRWVAGRLLALQAPPAPQDVQTTLLELTARTILSAVTQSGLAPRRLILCGGGACNAVLVNRIRELAGNAIVETTASHGLAPEHIEAGAFAWLASQTLAGRPGNCPAVTGASRETILGGIYPA